MGNSYHTTLGSDPEWSKSLPAGNYRMLIINWRQNEAPKLDYIVQVYQDTTQKISINGAHGTKFSSDTKFNKHEDTRKRDSPDPKEQEDPPPPRNGCSTGPMADIATYVKKKNVLVEAGIEGKWQSFHKGSETFACGMRQKVQPTGSGDNTGVNQIQFKWCKFCDWNQ